MTKYLERSFDSARSLAAHATFVLVVALFGAALAVPVSAAPASPEVKTLTQPDGTSFEARQWGDEWHHGWETGTGYTILFDDAKRRWVFALPSTSGGLSASNLSVGKDRPPADLKRFLRGTKPPMQQRSVAPNSAGAPARGALATGTNNILTVLINYKDRTPVYKPSDFNTLLFGAGATSMASYYKEVSYGLYTVSPGPAGTLGWYTAPLGHDTYAKLPGNLVYEAARAADNAGVNFQPYDMNGDCRVDVVNVIHQGTGQESSANKTDIWSHSWTLTEAKAGRWSQYGAYLTRTPCSKGGNISVDAYTIEPEILGGQMMTMGVFAHEYGHALGLPDLYDTDYTSGGAGLWSLMSEGTWAGVRIIGDRPSHMDPWSKYKLGWLTPQKITGSTPTTVTIYPANSAASAFQFGEGGPTSPRAEYFLVENRQRSGFDAGLPGSGMLVWHIDENTSTNNKECYPGGPSCSAQHYKVAVVQADNKWDLEKKLNKGDAGDPFPGSAANRNFNDATLPGSKLYSGYNSKLSISAITVSRQNILATMSYGTPAKLALNYTKAGTGAGAVTFKPAGSVSSCAASCTNPYTSGTVVTLTASPANGSRFIGWSGSSECTGKTACSLTMNKAKAVTATFNTGQQLSSRGGP